MSRGDTMTARRDIVLVQEDCCACDVIFAMPQDLRNRRLEDGQLFFCPRGHSMSFTEPENAKLRTEVDRLKAQLTHERDQGRAAAAQLAEAKAEASRLRKRATNGVCPCCNRTFVNLGRHMKGQHPDYSERKPS